MHGAVAAPTFKCVLPRMLVEACGITRSSNGSASRPAIRLLALQTEQAFPVLAVVALAEALARHRQREHQTEGYPDAYLPGTRSCRAAAHPESRYVSDFQYTLVSQSVRSGLSA
jgi:hypothetical protein